MCAMLAAFRSQAESAEGALQPGVRGDGQAEGEMIQLILIIIAWIYAPWWLALILTFLICAA